MGGWLQLQLSEMFCWLGINLQLLCDVTIHELSGYIILCNPFPMLYILIAVSRPLAIMNLQFYILAEFIVCTV